MNPIDRRRFMQTNIAAVLAGAVTCGGVEAAMEQAIAGQRWVSKPVEVKTGGVRMIQVDGNFRATSRNRLIVTAGGFL